MAQVYILSEDDFDDEVYVYILDVLLGTHVARLPVRLRRGGGIGEVRKKLTLFVSMIQRTGPVDDTYFVVAIDNDRAPQHSEHEAAAPRAAGCRHCDLDDAIHAAMPDGWPIPGVIAVPVQMIEAWLLLMYGPERYQREAALPQCGWRDQDVARRVYGADPPPQLKNLTEMEQREAGIATKSDFAAECVLRLDATDLAQRSPSFAHFQRQVSRWRARPPDGGDPGDEGPTAKP
jgi:hypothetical protein